MTALQSASNYYEHFLHLSITTVICRWTHQNQPAVVKVQLHLRVFVLSVTVQTAWSSARISRVIIVYTCFASESWVSSHSTSYHSNHYIYTVSSSLFSLFYVHWSIAASIVMYSGLTTTILTFTHPWATMDVDGQTNKQKLLNFYFFFSYSYIVMVDPGGCASSIASVENDECTRYTWCYFRVS